MLVYVLHILHTSTAQEDKCVFLHLTVIIHHSSMLRVLP